LVNNKSFFDAHTHEYQKDIELYYRPLVTILKKTILPKNILDIGCGDGGFIKSITKQGIITNYLGIDLSTAMIQTALKNLRNHDGNLVVADVFHLPLSPNSMFDLIHIDSVIHHIVGKTRSESKYLAKNILESLYTHLSEDGCMVVEEIYYGSYINSGLTAAVVFYGFKLINFLKLNLVGINKAIYPGLEVNFYSERELIKMLSRYGNVRVMKRLEYAILKLQRLFLLKNSGHITLLIKK
jgi:SAM-dependent methyltransferase